MGGNYIKVDRKILKWEWWSDINTFRLFMYMLLSAWWKNGSYKGVEIPRGSFPSSNSELSKETGLTDNEIRTALKHLKSTGEITSKSNNKFTVFTVKNYDLYQPINEQDYSQTTGNDTGKAQTINKPLTSHNIKECNNINNINNKRINNNPPLSPHGKTDDKNQKKESTVYYPNDEKLNSAFLDYMDMRKKIKKPMTDRAVALAMNKLQKLSTVAPSTAMDNDLAIMILEESTMNCWQSLYPLKNDNRNNGGQNGTESKWINDWRNA